MNYLLSSKHEFNFENKKLKTMNLKFLIVLTLVAMIFFAVDHKIYSVW